jgi:hypothetical protein
MFEFSANCKAPEELPDITSSVILSEAKDLCRGVLTTVGFQRSVVFEVK